MKFPWEKIPLGGQKIPKSTARFAQDGGLRTFPVSGVDIVIFEPETNPQVQPEIGDWATWPDMEKSWQGSRKNHHGKGSKEAEKNAHPSSEKKGCKMEFCTQHVVAKKLSSLGFGYGSQNSTRLQKHHLRPPKVTRNYVLKMCIE